MIYSKNIPLLSIHIPKCGGTSFKNILASWFGNHYYEHYFDEIWNIMPPRHQMKPWWSPQYTKNVCVHGHFDRSRGYSLEQYYPNIKQYITILREPLEVQLSLFFYLNELEKRGENFKEGKKFDPPKDVDEFLETTSSYILDFFPIDMTASNMKTIIEERFVHIGVMEFYQISIDNLAEKLGKPTIKVIHENSSPRISKPSSSSIKAFKSKSKIEYQLYDYAISLNKE